MQKLKDFFKGLVEEIKLNPEWLGIPLVFLSWVGVQRMLLINAEANAIIPDDVIQFFILASFGLLLGNFLAHFGIKYNNPSIWKQYKSSVKYGTTPPKEYFYYLVSYLLVYALILIAIMN
jgi:hypothetical protein